MSYKPEYTSEKNKIKRNSLMQKFRHTTERTTKNNKKKKNCSLVSNNKS